MPIRLARYYRVSLTTVYVRVLLGFADVSF
jgi:hypothetical protein